MRSRRLDRSRIERLALLGCLATLAASGFAATVQAAAPDASAEALEQRPHDPPRKPTGPLRTGPPARVEAGGLVSVQVNVRGGANIQGDAANEPSLAVDPRNPNRMAIGWRQFDTVLSDFRQAGWGYSQDAGRTWRFPGVIDPGVFRSDPVLGSDANGTFFYSSLTSDFSSLSVDFYVSTNGGMSWLGPVDAWGGDKQWFAVDRSGGIGRGNIYQTWALAGACCGVNTFTRSVNGGLLFEDPLVVPSNPQWGTMDVGPDGTLYMVGIQRGDMSRMFIVRSTTAEDPQYMPFFDLAVPVPIGGTVRALAGDLTPNPDGLLGQAWIAVDPSSGPHAGWVYIVCSVDPPGPDPMDVMFVRSTDSGATWSAPVRLNDDPPGAWQWMATMSVAPNGRIDVVWNDTRNSADLAWSELHYCVSVDGGTTWSGNAKISPAWNSHLGWPNQQKIGDYYQMVSDPVGANLAYAATFNGEQDIWFLRIGDRDCNANGVGDAIDLATHTSTDWNGNGIPDECEGLTVSDAAPAAAPGQLHANVPNPFNPRTAISFDLPAPGAVRLEILDVAGRSVRSFSITARTGRNTVQWDGTDAAGRAVASGVYVYRLQAPTFSAARRMVLAR